MSTSGQRALYRIRRSTMRYVHKSAQRILACGIFVVLLAVAIAIGGPVFGVGTAQYATELVRVLLGR